MKATKDNPFGILMYHRVTPRVEGFPAPTWNVTPDRFRRQLSGLLARGYRPWPLSKAIECRNAGEAIPSRTFVVTFDDGYCNVYHHAWPILKELSVPATVFVSTAYLDDDRPFVFDDWSEAGSNDVPTVAWRPLTTEQCREMIDDGLIEIGSHAHTHADLRGRPGIFQCDLLHSLEVLRERLGLTNPSFAFPYGHYSSETVAIAREAGVKCTLTTQPKIVSPCEDPFSWGRFNVEQFDSPASMIFKLTGWASMFLTVIKRLPFRSVIRRTLEGRKMAKLPKRTASL